MLSPVSDRGVTSQRPEDPNLDGITHDTPPEAVQLLPPHRRPRC